MLIDLTELEFCDSSGLRSLMGEQGEVRAQGGRMAVACPGGGAVARLLDLSGAREVLDVHPSADAALAALA